MKQSALLFVTLSQNKKNCFLLILSFTQYIFISKALERFPRIVEVNMTRELLLSVLIVAGC